MMSWVTSAALDASTSDYFEFNGFDPRQSDGKLVRCEKKASGETECRVVKEDRRK